MTRIYSCINPGKPSDSDTSQWATKMAAARAAGIKWCTAGMNWSTMQSTAGGSVATGVGKVISYLNAAQTAGLKVVLDLALHFAPSFVTSGVEQFKDQGANLWSDTGASGNNVRNWQWTAQGRTYVADLLTKIGADGTIPAHAALAGIRCGGGYAGEAHYVPITTTNGFPDQWWIYGTSLQTGTGLAGDQVVCPYPGRTPTFDGTNDAQDHAIANWWLNGMNTWVVWLLGQLKAAGFGAGQQQLWVMHPSTGVRTRPHTDSGWIQEVARGVDPRRLMAGYRWDNHVWPWSTWNDPGSSSTETGMGSATYLLEIARQYGKLGWFADENTHTNSVIASCIDVHNGTSIDSPNDAAGEIFNWLSYDSLVGGAVGDVTLSQYQTVIASYP